MDLLYVEDNPDDAEIFSRAIRKLDPPVTWTILTSGTQALDYLAGQGAYGGGATPLPKLILLDLDLPGCSGFEIIQKTRSGKRTGNLPIVIYSTSDNPRDIQRSYELGANAYVLKPGVYLEVGRGLRRILDFWLLDNLVT